MSVDDQARRVAFVVEFGRVAAPLVPEDKCEERRFRAGRGYDTSPQVGRCRAPGGALG
jgi:hypothetical protein